MKDASNTRRSLGKLGILTAAAVILSLTATIVPAVGADEKADIAKTAKKPVKVIKISIGTVVDGKPMGSVVKTVSRDGTAYVFHSDKKLSDEEVEQFIGKAQQSRDEARDAMVQADEVQGEAEAARTETDAAKGQADSASVAAAHARAASEIGRVEAIRVMSNMDFASYIPEIDIREITRNCREGQPVTTDVSGFDGQNKSRVRIVMCGKGQAKLARLEAIKGLREARSEIASDKDMPNGVRKDVIEKLEQQIRQMEARTD